MFEYIYVLMLFLTPFLLALATVGIILFSATHPNFGILCLFSAILLETYFVNAGSLNLGVNVHTADLIPLLLFFTGLVRWIFAKRTDVLPVAVIPIAVLAALLFLSLARGAISFGAAAGNDFRHFFYFFAVLVYILSFGAHQVSFAKLEHYWIGFSAALALLAVFRWSVDALGVSIGPDWHDFVAGGKLRVLHSGQALFIATGLVFMVASAIENGASGFRRVLMLFLGSVVLLLQHRSVWVATLVGLAFVIFQAKAEHRKRLILGLVWLSIVVAAIGFAFSYSKLDSVSDDLQKSVREVSEKRSSIAGRIDGWKELIGDFVSSGPIDMVIGKPMGSSYERYIVSIGRSVKENPHNFYVHILLRAGVVGFLLFIISVAIIVKRSLNSAGGMHQTRTRRILVAVVLMNVLYFFVYGAAFEQALTIGFAMILASIGSPQHQAQKANRPGLKD